MIPARPFRSVMILCAVMALDRSAAGAAESAEALIQKGVALRTSGNDYEALPLFQRAYELSPTPRATAQLGLVEQALGRWPEAETHLGKALEAHDSWVEKNRKVLGQSLATIRQHLAAVEISGEPRGASVSVNGRAVGRLPLPAPVRVGEGYIEIELAADGHQPAKRTLTVAGAKAYQLFVKLEQQRASAPPPLPPPPVVVTKVPPQPPPPAADASPGRGLRIAGIAVGAAGVLAVANGVRLSIKVRDLNQTVYADQPDKVAEGKSAARDQWISYGIGAAALAGGGILYYLGAREAETTAAFVPLPGGGLALARRRF